LIDAAILPSNGESRRVIRDTLVSHLECGFLARSTIGRQSEKPYSRFPSGVETSSRSARGIPPRGDEASAAIAAEASDGSLFWVKVSRLVENPPAAAEIPATTRALTGSQ